jgi:hypothetical protein
MTRMLADIDAIMQCSAHDDPFWLVLTSSSPPPSPAPPLQTAAQPQHRQREAADSGWDFVATLGPEAWTEAVMLRSPPRSLQSVQHPQPEFALSPDTSRNAVGLYTSTTISRDMQKMWQQELVKVEEDWYLLKCNEDKFMRRGMHMAEERFRNQKKWFIFKMHIAASAGQITIHIKPEFSGYEKGADAGFCGIVSVLLKQPQQFFDLVSLDGIVDKAHLVSLFRKCGFYPPRTWTWTDFMRGKCSIYFREPTKRVPFRFSSDGASCGKS